ncbi:cytochrome P450 [Cladochytrium replicatum]|nr:cytochrome P450 [Cladochytrium replicatum]
MVLLVLGVYLGLFIGAYFFLFRLPRNRNRFDSMPGLYSKQLPFIGNLLQVFPFVAKRRIDLFFINVVQTVGPIARLKIPGLGTCYAISDVNAVRKILKGGSDRHPNCFIRGTDIHRAAMDFSPFVLATLPSGPLWKKHRKAMQPAFGPVHLRRTFAVATDSIQKLLRNWSARIRLANETQSQLPVVKSALDMHYLVADIVCKVLMSVDFDLIPKEDEIDRPVREDVKEFFDAVAWALEHIMLRVMLPKWLWTLARVSAKDVASRRAVLEKVFKRAIAAKQSGTSLHVHLREEDPSAPNLHMDVLDRLLSLQSSSSDDPATTTTFTAEEVQGEMFTFLSAGQDGTTNAILFALFELSKRPDLQSRLASEIISSSGGGGPQSLTLEKLTDLRLLDAVVRETLRLHYITPFAIRNIAYDIEDGAFDVDGYTARKGDVVFVVVGGVHLSTEYYGPDAGVFNPDRWLDEKLDAGAAGTFLPFGDGPMNCIGQKIAMIEIRVALAHIFAQFKVELACHPDDIEIAVTTTKGIKELPLKISHL